MHVWRTLSASTSAGSTAAFKIHEPRRVPGD